MNEKPVIDSGAATIVSLADQTKFAPNGIVSRTLLRTATSRVVLFGFAEGQELTEHTSTQHAAVRATTQFSMLLTLSKPETNETAPNFNLKKS